MIDYSIMNLICELQISVSMNFETVCPNFHLINYHLKTWNKDLLTHSKCNFKMKSIFYMQMRQYYRNYNIMIPIIHVILLGGDNLSSKIKQSY